jgi:signal transduction histidine kinase
MGGIARWFHGREHIQLLLHWRWLVLLIAIPLSLVIELIEGRSEGLHLLDEVLLDGLILPITTWVVLTFAARKMAGQFKREADLERRAQFTQRLGEHREYYDLAQYLVRFPAMIVPVDQTHLYVFEPETGELKLIAEWSGQSMSVPPVQPTGPVAQSYSLVLHRDSAQVGLLRLRWREGEQPTDENIELLNSLAPDIAIALARAIEDTREAARVYRAAQAYERRRLTQELHDSLAQQVFYLNLSLDQLADDASVVSNEAVKHKLDSMRDVAADVYEQIRSNLSILRAWEQVDLTEAVSDLARSTARNADLSIAIDVQGDPGWLSPHTSESVYSAIREALNNVVKHAQAHHVQLVMVWSPERLAIRLTDDGQGFTTHEASRDGHYGLTLMRETVEALKGDVAIDSTLGKGTTLRLSIPLHTGSMALQTQPGLSQRLQNTLDLAVRTAV